MISTEIFIKKTTYRSNDQDRLMERRG